MALTRRSVQRMSGSIWPGFVDAMTALLLVFLFGPALINGLRVKQGRGQPIRDDGPVSQCRVGRKMLW